MPGLPESLRRYRKTPTAVEQIFQTEDLVSCLYSIAHGKLLCNLANRT